MKDGSAKTAARTAQGAFTGCERVHISLDGDGLQSRVANLSRQLPNDLANVTTSVSVVHKDDLIAASLGSVERVGEGANKRGAADSVSRRRNEEVLRVGDEEHLRT